MDDTCVCWAFIQCLMGEFLIRLALANSSLASYQADLFQLKDVTAVDYCAHACAGYAQLLMKPVWLGHY